MDTAERQILCRRIKELINRLTSTARIRFAYGLINSTSFGIEVLVHSGGGPFTRLFFKSALQIKIQRTLRFIL
jgi:hypothetical protein